MKYAGEGDFLEISPRNSLKETVDSFLQVVKWRPRLFQFIDLSCAETTWKTFCEIVNCCAELKILNMTGIEAEISRHPLIGVSKLVKLNLSETLLDDLACITKIFSMLGILNVSRCFKLTNAGVEQPSFPSLRLLALANCMIGIDAILYILEKHGVFALCVKEIKLKSEDIAHLVELYPGIAEIGIPTLWPTARNCVSASTSTSLLLLLYIVSCDYIAH